MDTITLIPRTKKEYQTIKEFAESFQIPIKNEKEKPYNKDFVNKILQRSENAKEGNTITIDTNNVWKSLGLK